MVQTLISKTILAGQKLVLLGKPIVSNRVFFSIRALADDATWYKSLVSFGDPLFRSFFVLNGPGKYFEARGEGIFQGDIWVYNQSEYALEYTATEILI